MDLTEAEDIKKRRQEYTEELYKKDLHDQDNHDGVITHLDPISPRGLPAQEVRDPKLDRQQAAERLSERQWSVA